MCSGPKAGTRKKRSLPVWLTMVNVGRLAKCEESQKRRQDQCMEGPADQRRVKIPFSAMLKTFKGLTKTLTWF